MRICFLVFFFSLFFLEAKQLEVEIQSDAAILINSNTGSVLYEKNSSKNYYPASTTKIATALYILDQIQIDLNQSVRVSEQALKMKNLDSDPSYFLENDGTKMGLKKR